MQLNMHFSPQKKQLTQLINIEADQFSSGSNKSTQASPQDNKILNQCVEYKSNQQDIFTKLNFDKFSDDKQQIQQLQSINFQINSLGTNDFQDSDKISKVSVKKQIKLKFYVSNQLDQPLDQQFVKRIMI